MTTPTTPSSEGGDGWIEWNGGDRPHPPATEVEVKFRSGRYDRGVSACGRWWHEDSDPDGDIVSYRIINATPKQLHVDGWQEVPKGDLPLSMLKSINIDNQVLAYENGRYYNAWFEFEPSEGGWYWTDEADSEPNPSHFMPLPKPPSEIKP